MYSPVFSVCTNVKLERLSRAGGHAGGSSLAQVGTLAWEVGTGRIKRALAVGTRDWSGRLDGQVGVGSGEERGCDSSNECL